MILLLILAGVTIGQITENNLFEKIQLAKEKYTNAYNKEEKDIAKIGNEIDLYTSRDIPLNTYNGINYSLEEIKTNDIWMGKPLYTKTLYISSLPSSTSGEYAHNISNVDTIWVSLDNSFIKWNSTTTGSIPAISTSGFSNQIGISVTKEKISITVGSTNRSALSAYVTLKYTKTTDAATNN